MVITEKQFIAVVKQCAPPWLIESDDLKENFTARFDLTGVDARTGRIETFSNASFGYGIASNSPIWSIAGHSASYALSEIHSYAKTHNVK